MIEVKGLTKVYGKNIALNNVSFEINDGEIVGLLGPNGAGKTTTMNIITGYLSCTSGSVTVDDFDVFENPKEVKKLIGYLPENPPLYMEMTVWDYLSFVYDLKKAQQPKEEHLNEILETVKITDVKNRLIKNLSKGYKQRIGMAQALVGDPKILIFDEPTVGLDPRQINEIRDVIKALGKTKTVILSSHILSEISSVCEKIIVINKGEIVANDSLSNVLNIVSNKNRLNLLIEGDKDKVLPALEEIDGVAEVTVINANDQLGRYVAKTNGALTVQRDIFNKMAQLGFPILVMEKKTLSLEEVFLKITEKPKLKPEVTEEVEQNDSNI